MGELTSQFSREDIETLIEAVGDWEVLGNQEFHIMQMIRNVPLPPDDHEAYDAMVQIKEHYRKREREIQKTRAVRQEHAVFLKAKLMLVRKDLGISQLFNMASHVDLSAKPQAVPEAAEADDRPTREACRADASDRLELAEFFIKDLGVWDHYQKYLSEKAREPKENG